MCSTFSLNLVSLSSLHICTTSLKSINLHLPLRPFFTVAETRLHHSCLLLPGKLSSLHSPIHLQPLEGKASAAATAVAKAMFFLLLPHELPPLKTHTQSPPSTSSTPITTTMLECSLKAGAPSRSSVFSGPWPGNQGWIDKKKGKRVERET